MRRHTILCLISLVVACDKPPPKTEASPASAPIVKKPPPLGVLPGGIDPMRDMREDADQLRGHRLISGTVLAGFQAKKIANFRCDAPENTQGGVQGMVMTQSAMGCRQRKPGSKDERALIITIADYNAHPRMLSTQEAMVKQKASRLTQPIKVRGNPGYMQMDDKTKIGRGSVMLKRRFLVSAQLSDATFPELEAAINAVDIEGLLTLVTTAQNQVILDVNGNPASRPAEQKNEHKTEQPPTEQKK